MSDSLTLETDDEVADIVCSSFDSAELRKLASNVGASRERGDTKRQTAEKLVAQYPAVAARLAEEHAALPCDCGPFRDRREVGRERISLPEAANRAHNRKMFYRLKRLQNAMDAVPCYDAEANWEYAGDLTSIVITTEAEMNPLLQEHAHAILSSRGRVRLADVDEVDYTKKSDLGARSRWDLFCGRIERFYQP